MARTIEHPALALLIGAGGVLAAAVAPAGLDGRPAGPGSWAVWAVVAGAALVASAGAGVHPVATLRRALLLLPLVLLLAMPAALFAPAGGGARLMLALTVRSFAALLAASALAAWLGPGGIIAGLRQLRVPGRLVDVVAEALASIAVVLRNVRVMLIAREARRPRRGPWEPLARSPRETVRGFGRLVAALLLRSLERAEALERARRARGGGEG